MKNAVILYAHPNPKSFSNAIKETAFDFLSKNGFNVEVVDLYSINFNPILSAKDFENIQQGAASEDVKKSLKIKELEINLGKPSLEQKISEVTPNKSKIGPEFKKDAGKVMAFIKEADADTIEKMLSEGIETEFGILNKEHIKEVKRAIYNKGEIVETADIDSLIDTIAIIQ